MALPNLNQQFHNPKASSNALRIVSLGKDKQGTSKIKEEIENDKSQVVQITEQILDPRSITEYKFKKGKNVFNSSNYNPSVIRPKNLTNYMKFNLADIRK